MPRLPKTAIRFAQRHLSLGAEHKSNHFCVHQLGWVGSALLCLQRPQSTETNSVQYQMGGICGHTFLGHGLSLLPLHEHTSSFWPNWHGQWLFEVRQLWHPVEKHLDILCNNPIYSLQCLFWENSSRKFPGLENHLEAGHPQLRSDNDKQIAFRLFQKLYLEPL